MCVGWGDGLLGTEDDFICLHRERLLLRFALEEIEQEADLLMNKGAGKP